ncbi:MAG: LysE family translocator [Sphingopyxis sp.]|uniref:LysE family translocator n=1 Tax=Sphingopyxis sp. TaxID=1908224 RepID=UPI002ABB4041|nr:LysE family translocator [Sphingopyxis sp.]MDZ3830589.1 LysE family translocator [Sphingopyxis sp.]
MSEADWIGFALAVLLIELTPGPNMAWLAALSIGDGRRAGLAATTGIAIGLFVNALAAALGIAFIVSESDLLWQILRWGGALFLLWLAWESWRDAGENSPARVMATASPHRHFLSGMVVNLLNPKAMLFYVVVIPRFNGGQVPGFGLAIALALTSIAIATVVHLSIVFAGSRVGGWIADPVRTRRVRRALALAIVGVAFWFAVTAAR